MLAGLTFETSLNGTVGTITGYDRTRERYFFECDSTGEERNVKKVNLSLLSSDAGELQTLVLPRGVLNESLLSSVGALAIRVDCVSMSPSGIAANVKSTLPYADPCADRTPDGTACDRATAASCSCPGSVRIASKDAVHPVVAFLHSSYERGTSESSQQKENLPAAEPRFHKCGDTTHDRIAWLRQCLHTLPQLLPPHVTSLAFPCAFEGQKKASSYLTLLRDFAKSNPQLRVFAVDSTARCVSSLQKTHVRRNRKGSLQRREGLAALESADDPFSRMLSTALVDELEAVSEGAPPVMAASVLFASCVTSGVTPPTECLSPECSSADVSSAAPQELFDAVGTDKVDLGAAVARLRIWADQALARSARINAAATERLANAASTPPPQDTPGLTLEQQLAEVETFLRWRVSGLVDDQALADRIATALMKRDPQVLLDAVGLGEVDLGAAVAMFKIWVDQALDGFARINTTATVGLTDSARVRRPLAELARAAAVKAGVAKQRDSVSAFAANVDASSVLGSESGGDALARELQRAVDLSAKARSRVAEERLAIDESYRAYLRKKRESSQEAAVSLSTTHASDTLPPSSASSSGDTPTKPGFSVSSADGAHVPLRLLNLQVIGPEGGRLPVPVNIGDTGAATVILGLNDYERVNSRMPGAIQRVSSLATSYRGIRGVTGSSVALFHVRLTLDFDGVPITVSDCPVLAEHSGILIGVDVGGRGRANISFEPESSFAGTDGFPIPCDGFMQLRDASMKVTGSLPFVHRVSTLETLRGDPHTPESICSAFSAATDTEASAVPIAYAPSAVRVPEWSEQMVRARIPAAAVGDHHLAVLPLEDSRIDDIGVLVAPCLQKPDADGYVWLRVVNPSQHPVHIGALTPLARFVVHPTVSGANIKYTVDEIMSKINLDPSCTGRARELVREMLSKRRSLFADELGWAQGMKQRIPLREGAEPPNEQCRRLSPQEYTALKNEVDKQLKQRLIMPIVSPFSAAPMVIAKPPAADGSVQYRVVLDFRRLNEITDRDSYPLPRVDENLARLGRAKLFTTADLLMGFHQVELEADSIPATAFSTPWGQFAYTRMPMGLTSSPSAFMRIVDATLRGLPQNIALAYCDDIICFTDGDMEQHMRDVGMVFDKLIEGGFTVRCDKVHVGKKEVPYLGFMVGSYGTRPMDKKISPILQMVVSTIQKNPKAAARFAGMVGVYQKFIPQCHQLLAPFHEMRVKHSDGHNLSRRLRFLAAFEALKHALCTLTALNRPDLSKPMYVSVDAAATGGASGVLSQRRDQDDPTSLVPLAFWSTRFSEVQRGWPIRDQECYAMHDAMMEWKHYLLGAHVIVHTDHRSLQYLLTGKLRDGGRVTDWAMDLRGFDAQIEWIAGSTNIVPDTLSRVFTAQSREGVLPSPKEGEKKLGEQGAKADMAHANNALHSNDTSTSKQQAQTSTMRERSHCRIASIFIRKNSAGKFEVLLERDGDEYSLPSVAADNSDSTYREQLLFHLFKQYGDNSCVYTKLKKSGQRLASSLREQRDTVIYVTVMGRSDDVSPCHRDGGFVELTSSTARILDHDDDWNALAFIEDYLQGRHRKQGGTSGLVGYRLSCLPSVLRLLENDSKPPSADGVVSAASAVNLLPSVVDKPSGPAFVSSPADAIAAVTLLRERLQQSEHPVMAVDLEGNLGGSKWSRRHIDLLQVCVDGEHDLPPLVYVFDTDQSRQLLLAKGITSMRSLLEDPSIAKVFHCCHGDCASLFEEYDIALSNVFDTAIADSLINGVHYNTNRGLNAVLIDWLGEDVVHLTYKGSLVHEVGMFQQRPLPEHLFVYAYEDVLYLSMLYHRLSQILRQRGSFALWSTLSSGRAPPLSLPLGSRHYRNPTTVTIAITDGTELICIKDEQGVSLPSGLFTQEELLGANHSYKAASLRVWSELFSKPSKTVSGLHLAVNSRLRTPVRLGDTLLAVGIVPSCRLVLEDLTAIDLSSSRAHAGSLLLNVDTISTEDLGEQRALFEYVFLEATRRYVPRPPAIVTCGEGFVAASSTLPKKVAAVIVHDTRSVVTCLHASAEKGEYFPSVAIGPDVEGIEAARQALTRYLGPALIKGGDATEHTTSSVLLPCFSPLMLAATERMRYVCTYGNTEYYSCFLPDCKPLLRYDSATAPPLAPALNTHYAAFAAARVESNGYRQTETDQKKCKATSIRPFADTAQHFTTGASKTNFDAIAMSVVEEMLVNGDFKRERSADVAVSQHSDHDPLTRPIGDDPVFDRLFEAAFIVNCASLVDAHYKDAREGVCFANEGLSQLPSDALPSRREVREEQRLHPGMSKFIDYLVEGSLSEAVASMDAAEKKSFMEESAKYELSRDGLLLRRAEGVLQQPRIWLPPRYYTHVCRAYHDRMGHWGVAKTEALIRERYVWGSDVKEMRTVIRRHISNCRVCAHSKVPHHQTGSGRILSTGEHPYDILGADVYKVGRDADGFDAVLSFGCYFSRHITAVAVKGDPTSEGIARLLISEVIRHYGVPSEIRSDQGSNFVSRAIRLLYAKYGIRISPSTAYHHRTIGLIERWHSSLKSLLLSERFAVGLDSSAMWTDYLPLLQLSFNATVNRTTGHSPFFVIHGRHCRLPFDSVLGTRAPAKSLPDWVSEHLERLGVVYDAVAKCLRTNALHRQKAFDLKRDVVTRFSPGETVLLLKGSVVDKNITKKEFATEGPYLGPFTIFRELENGNYELRDLRTRRIREEVNVDRLVPYPRPLTAEERVEDRFPVRCIVARRCAKLERADKAAGLVKGETVLQYRIRWVGFPSTSDSWRSWHYLSDIKELVDAFDKRHGHEPATLQGESRDSAIRLTAPDAKAVRRKHFRRRPQRPQEAPLPHAEEASSSPVEEHTAAAHDSVQEPEQAVSSQQLGAAVTLEERERRLERRRMAREQQLAAALAFPSIMTFTSAIEESVTAQSTEVTAPLAIDLCAGCGGLALAAQRLGYHHAALVENDPSCVETLKKNGFGNALQCALGEMDWSRYSNVQLLTGGPPCQPWSIGGVDSGADDERNLWDEVVRAVREIQPTLFLFEMVSGFLRDCFLKCRLLVLSQLRSLGYNVEVHDVNARDAGLPQDRKRCFITGHRLKSLVKPPTSMELATLRDALHDLGEPDGENRHELKGSAKEYRGHLANDIDTLARTLRAGRNGPGGGSNTLRLPGGDVRYFTIREMARIQGFPDSYQFSPVWSRAVKELGNACPPPLAEQWLMQLRKKSSAQASKTSLTVPALFSG
ncbi:DNA (cytosine-5-)-methyltransferase [bacterium]|nr:DNA (cytosine-5-)-methyltransferase [bacterium]